MSAEARATEHQVQLDLTRDSLASFRAAFDNAAVGIAHVAPDGRLLRVNGALCRILGYPADDLLTKSLQDVSYQPHRVADFTQGAPFREGEIGSRSWKCRLWSSPLVPAAL
jgi:PAS domain-containing protein